MTRHPARQATTTRPVVHYYPTPEPTAIDLNGLTDLAVFRQHAAELAARRKSDRILYARWKERQAEIAVRDRRNRRILLTIALPLTVALLGALGTAGWLLWHALTDVRTLAVAALVLVALAALGGAGHRCITVVQHWH
jgi:hypothetical protein